MPAKDNRQDRLEQVTKRLGEGLQGLFKEDAYRRYLSTMAKFHTYSYGNILLLASQRLDATLVAGCQAWQKNFARQVKKGEKGIVILAPVPYKKMVRRPVLDAYTGQPKKDTDGSPLTESVEITQTFFRPVTVFDISQTEGPDLPQPVMAKELSGQVEAESVAFVVADYLGLDTAAYSFPYIASWSGTEGIQTFRSDPESGCPDHPWD